ncbi:hypothetical protein ABBQ38_013443 [Trebouxia sp. C0009 RCD-2024]
MCYTCFSRKLTYAEVTFSCEQTLAVKGTCGRQLACTPSCSKQPGPAAGSLIAARVREIGEFGLHLMLHVPSVQHHVSYCLRLVHEQGGAALSSSGTAETFLSDEKPYRCCVVCCQVRLSWTLCSCRACAMAIYAVVGWQLRHSFRTCQSNQVVR